jgi:hypothetical protein
MIVDKYGNYVRKFMWQLCGWRRADIWHFISVHLNFLYHWTLIWQFSNLRHYELSKKCQLNPTHTVATYIFVHSCHTYPQSFWITQYVLSSDFSCIIFLFQFFENKFGPKQNFRFISRWTKTPTSWFNAWSRIRNWTFNISVSQNHFCLTSSVSSICFIWTITAANIFDDHRHRLMCRMLMTTLDVSNIS